MPSSQSARSARARLARRLADDEAVRHVPHAGRRGAPERRPPGAWCATSASPSAIGGGCSSDLADVAGQVRGEIVERAARRRDVDEPEQRGAQLVVGARPAPSPARRAPAAGCATATGRPRGSSGRSRAARLCTSRADPPGGSSVPPRSSVRCCATSARPRPSSGSRPTALRGRGARHARAHLPRRGPPLRAGAAAGLEPSELARVRGPARRRARLARADSSSRRAASARCRQDEPVQSCFGSCRVAAPHEPPYSLRKDEDERGREIDALRMLALRMREEPREEWPDCCSCSATRSTPTRARRERRRSSATRRAPRTPPGDRVVDFEEYTQLYRESWCEPAIRWLFSTVSTAMIFDDHDMHDDWNISQPLGRGDAREALVERAHRRRADVVLGLPAPRQRPAARARRRRAAARVEAADDGGRCCASSPPRRPTEPTAPLELLPRLGDTR